MDDERRLTGMTTAGKDNLKRAEAQERARLIGDVSYDIKLNLREGAITFGSETTVKFSCRDTSKATFIDFDAVELQEVIFNGRVLDLKETTDGRIPLDSLDESNELRVVATCEYS